MTGLPGFRISARQKACGREAISTLAFFQVSAQLI